MSNVERARQSLSEYYEESLRNRVGLLDGWLAAFDPTGPDQQRAIRREGHQMRGSGASFGFPGISDCGAAVELAPEGELEAALALLIAEIRRALVELAAQNHPDRPA